MASHTPAPWVYTNDHRERIRGADGEAVAWYVDECDRPLITAAPDLLKWGEHNLLCYKNLRAACGLTNDLQDIREFEAAIAKAKGESTS